MADLRRSIGVASAALGLIAALTGCGPKTAAISVTMTDFAFDPVSWEVPRGAEVTVTITNQGSVIHEWDLMKQDYAVTLPWIGSRDRPAALQTKIVEPGQTVSLTFKAPTEAGDYPVVCAVLGHLENGMQGTLSVK